MKSPTIEQTELKNRVVKGCGFSALTAMVIIGLVFMAACVVCSIVPRKYEARVVYSGVETIARPQTYKRLAGELGLAQRWQITPEEVVTEIGDTFTFSELGEESEQLVVLRTDMDEAAELANAWAGIAGVKVIQGASPNPVPAYPDIRKTLAVGLLAGIALALPPAAMVLWLCEKAKGP